MTYGLQVDTGTVATAADISQINTTTPNTYGFGNFSTIPSTGYITLGSTDLLFVNFSRPSSSDSFKEYSLQKVSVGNYTHRLVELTTTGTTSATGNMCILSDMSQTLTSSFLASSTQDYGLQIKNSEGTVILDTRGFGDGGNFTPTKILEPLSVKGMGADHTSDSVANNTNALIAPFTISGGSVVGPYIGFDYGGESENNTLASANIRIFNNIIVANQYKLRNVNNQIIQNLDPMDGYYFKGRYVVPVYPSTASVPVLNNFAIMIGEKFT